MRTKFFLAILFVFSIHFYFIVFLMSSVVIGFCFICLDTLYLFPFFIDIRKKS